MDIPGLNEKDTNYIDIIFSLINKKNILFEIIVFDSNTIKSDNILNIFKSLEKKKALIKKNNLFILNKIDQCQNEKEKEDIVDSFKENFY